MAGDVADYINGRAFALAKLELESEKIFFRREPCIVFKEHHEIYRNVGDAVLFEDFDFI